MGWIEDSRKNATGIFSWGRHFKNQSRSEYESSGGSIFDTIGKFVPGAGSLSFLTSAFTWGKGGSSLDIDLGMKQQKELEMYKYGIGLVALYLIVAKWK